MHTIGAKGCFHGGRNLFHRKLPREVCTWRDFVSHRHKSSANSRFRGDGRFEKLETSLISSLCPDGSPSWQRSTGAVM